MSYDLIERMRGRDGLIAMGAIAGVATYVLDRLVLQLEGIVGDRRLVEHVRHEDPLEDVLDEYHADYLVVSLASVRAQAHEGCYLVTQPNAEWAGERTSRLRGEICAEPVERFYTSGGLMPGSASRGSRHWCGTSVAHGGSNRTTRIRSTLRMKRWQPVVKVTIPERLMATILCLRRRQPMP
jgi:hypothetical protein